MDHSRPPDRQEGPRSITIALAGQPNVGKSTVFNMLTGLNQHVGNWPGKTVEHRSGTFVRDGRQVHLVDLPGTYSLTANSEEERLARDFIIRQQPDVTIVIVNAAALERNLYLVAELLALPTPLVVGLNMIDVAEQAGLEVEPHVLSAALGIPVIPLVASCNEGLAELVRVSVDLVDHPTSSRPNRPTIREAHRPVLEDLQARIAGHVPAPYPEDWVALKLLEGDTQITDIMRQAAPSAWQAVHAVLASHEDAYLDIAGGRYEWIGRMVRAGVVRPRAGVVSVTDRIDRVATHPVWGVLLLLGAFGLVFGLTYGVAMPIVDWLQVSVLAPIIAGSRLALAPWPPWSSGLIADGLLAGAGTVVAFLPILVIFFAVLALLEDIGYLARGAYVMDRLMHPMGLHGKSFLPLFLGFGCNVPAILGTRIVDNRRAQRLTVFLVPLVPCSARMAVVTFLAPAFFGQAAGLVLWILVLINVTVMAIAGVIINRLAFRGEHSAFIMEMPLYHLPNLRTIGLDVWQNTSAFLRKAGTVILLAAAVTWALSQGPGGNAGLSPLARLGRSLEPVGAWMGLGDWRLLAALLSSIVAKENTIATLGILYEHENPALGLAERVAQSLTPPAAVALLVVQMLFVPCVASLAVMRKEAGTGWMLLSIGLSLVTSLAAGALVYQIGRVIMAA